MTTLQISQLDAPFGVVVEGFNPTTGLNEGTHAEIRDALDEHTLLLFRGQGALTDAELVRFAGYFGELFDGGELFGMKLKTKEILELVSERDEEGHETGPSAVTPLPWHTDYSYLPNAAQESFLNAVALPEGGGGATCFADAYGAYEALTPEMKERIEPLIGFHQLQGSGRYTPEEEKDEIRTSKAHRDRRFRYPGGGKANPHPVARRHPRSGRTALYVNSLVATVEHPDTGPMVEDEATALLQELYREIVKPERVYAHQWQLDDLVVFDTVGTLHRRDGSPAGDRTMRQLSTLLR
ncbi:MAG: alpha-ketoglutarate-dependent taurine dioxygenase [Acidimicrobiales bacterium]|jgi:alpha-ketoglutarate-dependent taurine dioxygenase